MHQTHTLTDSTYCCGILHQLRLMQVFGYLHHKSLSFQKMFLCAKIYKISTVSTWITAKLRTVPQDHNGLKMLAFSNSIFKSLPLLVICINKHPSNLVRVSLRLQLTKLEFFDSLAQCFSTFRKTVCTLLFH